MTGITIRQVRGNGDVVDFGTFDGSNAPGIQIADGGMGTAAALTPPRLLAFVYGEELPRSPTLPFGRWKRAS